MTINEKVVEIKKIISMICDVVPVIFTIIKDIIVLVKDFKVV